MGIEPEADCGGCGLSMTESETRRHVCPEERRRSKGGTVAKRKTAVQAELDRLRAQNDELSKKVREYGQEIATQKAMIDGAHSVLTEHGAPHGALKFRLEDLAKNGTPIARVNKAEREEKIELLTKELDKQRALTMEGHRQYDAVSKKLQAVERQRDEYESTIHTLAALLSAKPREHVFSIGIDWGEGPDKSVRIPAELVGTAFKSWTLHADRRPPLDPHAGDERRPST